MYTPVVGDRVSFINTNGTRTQGIFGGYKLGSDTIVRVWHQARATDGGKIGVSGWHYALADTLKKGRKIRPVKRFGKVIGKENIVHGFDVESED